MKPPTQKKPPAPIDREGDRVSRDTQSLPARTESGDLALDSEEGRIVAVMSTATRKGRWEPPAKLVVFAMMGGAELDFREANLYEGETIVDVTVLMGGVEILIPPDVDVECEGTGFMGGFSSLSYRARADDAPLLRIRGWAVMGGVDVKVKKLPLRKRLLGD